MLVLKGLVQMRMMTIALRTSGLGFVLVGTTRTQLTKKRKEIVTDLTKSLRVRRMLW
jgi:hypothetical protein